MAYDFARVNNLMYRYHALAWGSQYPEWIKELSPEAFQEALEAYIAAVAERYPFTDQVDVLNEQLREHAEGTQYFRDKLGGTGTTGYDWQIWIFASRDRKSTRLNSSHVRISYAVFCLKKKKRK